ncbi:hypothetical protein LJR015_004001 [Peribacillus frigoritolerans]|uniref:hypothetical protein n=1 Tax=Peribacillus frigoritolerans TaxID=450367 RepID=UPI003ED0C90E
MKKVLSVGFAAMLLTACGSEETATINKEEYNKIESGMTLDEIKSIVGGKEKSIYDDGTFIEYEFDGENGAESDASVTLMFNEEEVLDTKIENGLLSSNKAQETMEDTSEVNDENVEVTREEEIEKKAKGIIKENYNFTKVKELEVNQNLGLNDGSYIVLPHLKWDAMNNTDRSKRLLEMYSDDLAATLAKEGDISELVVFWEVPYHLEGKNVAKFTYTKKGEDMIIGERWYDPSLR